LLEPILLRRGSYLGYQNLAKWPNTITDVFNEKRLKVDVRKVVLCYKVQFKMSKVVNNILAVGPNKYAFIHRGKGLLWGLACQSLLNDASLASQLEEFGRDMSFKAAYYDLIHGSSVQIRQILKNLLKDPKYKALVQNESYGFLAQSNTFEKAMEIAEKTYSWHKQYLRG